MMTSVPEGRALHRRERNAAMPDPARFVLEVIKPIGQYRVDDVALGVQQQRDALRML